MAEKFKAKVKEIIYLNHIAKAIRFEFDRKLNFIPGQFIMIELNLQEKNGFKIPEGKLNIQKRAFSISSNPQEKLIEITAKKTTNPFVSEYIVDHLDIGDECNVMAPYGHFNLNLENTNKNLLFLRI